MTEWFIAPQRKSAYQNQISLGAMIDELKLENFRSFRSLELNGLKRVNVVVGENNSGKTSLLEALFLLSNAKRVHELPTLFRPAEGNHAQHYFRWLLRDGSGEVGGTVRFKFDGRTNELLIQLPDGPIHGPKAPVSIFQNDGVKIFTMKNPTMLGCRAISVHHTQPHSLVSLFGKTVRKGGGEETLQELLKEVDPRIRKIRIDPGDNQSSNSNQLIVDVGLSELIPLTQAGQGIYRLVSILSDIIGESPQVLLIDEIENGLHHSVLEQVWTGLAVAAEKLGVQIFATTHSDECLRAAHAAFQSRSNYDLGVIQLFRVESGVQGRVLGKEHIEASIAGNIDLR